MSEPILATTSNNRSKLTRERVVLAALSVVRQHGEAGLTMRSVAKALGCTTMAPYRHIQDREDLLYSMMDLMAQELELPDVNADAVEEIAQLYLALYGLLRREPWLVSTIIKNRKATPNIQPLLDRLTVAFGKIGLEGYDFKDTYFSLLHFTYGEALVYEAEENGQKQSEDSIGDQNLHADHNTIYERKLRWLLECIAVRCATETP